MSEVLVGVYRQHVLTAIEVAGDVAVRVTTHGGEGRDREGAYITITFGDQVMITMYDQLAALAYAYAWRNPQEEEVFARLPEVVRKGQGQAPVRVGPSMTIRASRADRVSVGFDAVAGSARVRIGCLTWSVLDRAAADPIREAWGYVAQLAPIVLAEPAAPARRRR
jgi:hypothetical protein